jgi:hypothetical protein
MLIINANCCTLSITCYFYYRSLTEELFNQVLIKMFNKFGAGGHGLGLKDAIGVALHSIMGLR